MTKEQRAEMYRIYLTEEGYSAQIDSDGDVTFKFEGGSYFIAVDDEDEEFFRVVYPNFWSIEDEDERQRVHAAALETTAETKVVKIIPLEDDTWASIEMFCSPPQAFQDVFQRCLGTLQAGVVKFREKMTASADG